MSEHVYHCTSAEYRGLQQELQRIQHLLDIAVVCDDVTMGAGRPLSDASVFVLFGKHYHSVMYYNFDLNTVGMGTHWQKKSATEGALGWRDVHAVCKLSVSEYQTVKSISKNNRWLAPGESVVAFAVVPVTRAVYETAMLVNPNTVFKRASLTSKHVFGCYVLRNDKTGDLRLAPWIKCPYNRDEHASDCLMDALMWGVKNVAR